MAVTEADVDRFCDKVFNRSRHLIATGAWSGVDRGRLDSWIEALKSHDSAVLAAALLDNLIYRSKAQFQAMFESVLLSVRLPEFAHVHDTSFVESLSARVDPLVRFAPVIAPDQPPTKSGPYVLRLLQRQFRMRDPWLIWPSQIVEVPTHVKYVFLVDDFTGTGEQFLEFWKKQRLDEVIQARPDIKVVLMAAAIHSNGIDSLRRAIPGLAIMHAELLGGQHHFATGTGLDLYREPELKKRIVGRLEEVCTVCGIGQGRTGVYGWGELGLSYAFEHATPNNTLPIYWFESDRWAPLLSR